MSTRVNPPLTAAELEELDEIHFDRKGLDATVKRVMTFASNSENELVKKERAWWRRALEVRGMPNDGSKLYKTTIENGRHVILDLGDVDEEQD